MTISIKEAEELLKKEYHIDNFKFLVKELLLTDFRAEEHVVEFKSDIFERVTELGKSTGCEISVFEVLLKEGAQNRRVAITQEMFRVLRGQGLNNALVAFANADKQNYRVSLLTSKYEFEGNKVVKVLSNPRRYSYSLGYNTKTKTAYDFLIAKGKVNSLNELIDRFSVEVVNKQFYKEIAQSFTRLIGGKRDNKMFEKELKLQSVVDSNKYAEFAVRLIGRIVFCWFLKEKKSEKGIPLIPEEMLSLKAIEGSVDYYHDVLEPLFFEMLNTPQNKRKGKYGQEEQYALIPYLNGGLFSPHNGDLYKFSYESQTGQYGVVTITKEWFIDFFKVLSQYNFTVDENTSYDIELSIDPEMLGRIFENLLAEINPETGENAKKSTGSFYTPRDIVDYMVDSSLLEFLKTKTAIDETRLKALISYSKEDDDLAVFTDQEKKSIINALYSITILDPACGSGAFPIGMLQKIVYILQEIDPEANLWFDKATENVSILLKREFEKKFNSGSLDYIRKLFVIQNSIFGVDIQPIAVEIARLRCFLSLVIEEKVLDNEPNRGINALPNLDFKFIIANTLVPLSDKDKGSLFENEEHINKLKRVRENYFSAEQDEKTAIKYEFSQIQNEMYEYLYNFTITKASERYQSLFRWKPFDNEPTSWFDAEWMFGVRDGFDIVIGNPPYVSAVTNSKDENIKIREQLRRIYPSLQGAFDLYAAFLCLGVNLTKKEGVYTWIIPNKFLVAKYAQKVMAHLIKNGLTSAISISHISVFDNVGVYPIIICGQKSKSNNFNEYKAETLTDLANNKLEILVKLKAQDSFKDKGIKFASGTTGFQAKQIVKYISEEEREGSIPFIVSGCVDRYEMKNDNVRYMGESYYKANIIHGVEIADSKWNFWNNEKIVIAGMTKQIEAFYSETPIALGVGVYAIYDYGGYNPKALTAILNSKYLTFYLIKNFSEKHLAGGYLAINKETLEQLPLVDIDKEQQLYLSKLYDKKVKGEDVDKDIDKMVYKLYNLTSEEIALVEEAIK